MIFFPESEFGLILNQLETAEAPFTIMDQY